MSIQKKSLISTLNTTKKAIVANPPAIGSATPSVVKAGVKQALGQKLGVKQALGQKLGVKQALGQKL